MPRIAEGRPAAEPVSAEQKERYRRILRAAALLGAEHGLERVQMHDVARDAGVAIATLYRYFPSKTHLFSAVMRWQVSRIEVGVSFRRGADPATAVGDLLISISHEMARRPRLSLAMIQANSQAQAATIGEVSVNDAVFQGIVLDVLGVERSSAEDDRRVRLIVHCWYGVLVSLLNGRFDIEQAEGDIRAACRLLISQSDARVLNGSDPR